MRPEGGEGDRRALWRRLQPGAQSGLTKALGVPLTRRTCRRIICTWGYDNTNDFFFFFTSHLRCLQSELYFFVIPLSLLKGECVFLWEE